MTKIIFKGFMPSIKALTSSFSPFFGNRKKFFNLYDQNSNPLPPPPIDQKVRCGKKELTFWETKANAYVNKSNEHFKTYYPDSHYANLDL